MRTFIAMVIVAAFSIGTTGISTVMAVPDGIRFNRCDRPSFNRGIEEMSFRESRTGAVIAQVKVYLGIGDTTDERLDLSFGLNLYVNDELKATIPQDVVKGGAITCAVTCAGKCPSIFGDGVCTSCGCDYDNWLTHEFGDDDIHKGDKVTAEIVPARGALGELFMDDDILETKFHQLSR